MTNCHRPLSHADSAPGHPSPGVATDLSSRVMVKNVHVQRNPNRITTTTVLKAAAMNRRRSHRIRNGVVGTRRNLEYPKSAW